MRAATKDLRYFVTERISDNMRITPEGFLLCLNVPFARTGLQEYGADETPLEPDGDNPIVKIMRKEEDVFKPEVLASFEGKPVTLGHPDGEMVNPENFSRLTKGIMQDVRRGEGAYSNSLVCDILIMDKEAITEVMENGLREVSGGYYSDYVQTGAGAGEQKNIVGNHLALVENGRAGSSYAIKDHKGVYMKLTEKLSKWLDGAGVTGKHKEDALKAVATLDKTDKVGTEIVSDDFQSMKDDLSAIKDALAAMAKGKTGDGDEPPPKEKKTDDAEGDPMKKVMDALDAMGKRLDALEAGTGDEEEEEPTGDEEEGEESGDESYDHAGYLVGDAKGRSEILAPGKKFKGPTAKSQALKAAYATTDGKAVIDILTGGKEPEWKKTKTMDALFDKAADVLRIKRAKKFPQSRATIDNGHADAGASPTIEDINEANAKHYSAQQRSH